MEKLWSPVTANDPHGLVKILASLFEKLISKHDIEKGDFPNAIMENHRDRRVRKEKKIEILLNLLILCALRALR